MRRLIIAQGVVGALLTAGLAHSQPAAPEASVNPISSQGSEAGTTPPPPAPIAAPAPAPSGTPSPVAPVAAPPSSTVPPQVQQPGTGEPPAAVSTGAPSVSEVETTLPVATTPPAAAPPSVVPSAPVVAPVPPAPVSPAAPPSEPNDSVDSSEAEVEASHESAETTLEDPEPSQGHFIALGVHGVSAMAFDEYRGTRAPTFGSGLSLRFGEALTDWLDLSLSFALAFTSGNVDDSVTFGRFGLQSQWYLSDRLFIQAGFGATNAQGKDPEDHDLVRGRYGDVYLTGIGYNFYLSDSDQSGGWVFTPVLTAEVGPDRTFTTTALWLGFEISWWTGLSRDKLNLPLSKAYDKSPE